MLYKACTNALGFRNKNKNKKAIALTNYLVQMTLHWSQTNGAYNPSRAFKFQETNVYQTILSCPCIPSHMDKPMKLVREHLQLLHRDIALHRYEKNLKWKTNKRAKEDSIIDNDDDFFPGDFADDDPGDFADDDNNKLEEDVLPPTPNTTIDPECSQAPVTTDNNNPKKRKQKTKNQMLDM
jgi:hypothetical protein